MCSDILSEEDLELIESIPIVQVPKNWKPVIKDKFTYDYDIRYVDERVKSKLHNEKIYELSILKSKIMFTMNRLSKGKHTHVNYLKMCSEINDILREIKDIVSNRKYERYISESRDLLAEYNRIYFDIYQEVDFNNDIVNKNNNLISMSRIHIIEQYLEVAKNYIDIDVRTKPLKESDFCTNCDEELDCSLADDSGSITCPNCNTINSSSVVVKDFIGNVTVDESIENFKKAVAYYQCKNIKMNDLDKVIEELDDHFKANHKPTREYYLQNPLDEYGIRVGTSHSMLLAALKKIKRTNYYKYVFYIGHKYWDWAVRDLSDVEETIFRHYDETQKAYNRIPPKLRERTSSLGTNFRLYKHLEIVGHKCQAKEFKIAENEKSLALHNDLWKLTLQICNNPEIPFIDTSTVTIEDVNEDFARCQIGDESIPSFIRNLISQ